MVIIDWLRERLNPVFGSEVTAYARGFEDGIDQAWAAIEGLQDRKSREDAQRVLHGTWSNGAEVKYVRTW